MDESDATTRRFVMTGAPGAGKTEILRNLLDHVQVVEEPARAIIAEQRASGGRGTWDQDPALFVRLILDRAIEDHARAGGSGGATVFDRGIPDCVVYAIRAGLDPTPALEAAAAFRYEPEILFLEPWEDIYTNDDERILDFVGAAEFGEAIRDEYRHLGYSIVTVPHGPIVDRVAFVRDTVVIR